MLIAITGTPGTGKSTFAEILAQKTGWYRLDLSEHYKQIAVGYDKKKHCYVVDVKKFTMLIKKKLKQYPSIIVDSHIAHLLPKELVDTCIVLTCSDLKKLKKRLQQRDYFPQKIKENLDAEILQVCLREAEETHNHVVVLDGSKMINTTKLIQQIRTYSERTK